MRYALLFITFILAWPLLTASGFGQSEVVVQTDTPPDTVILYMLPEPDNEFPRNPGEVAECIDCEIKAQAYESVKLKWFRDLVYDPAMKNPELSEGNKQFLDALPNVRLVEVKD